MLGLGNSLVGGSPTEGPFSVYSGSFDGTADFVLLPEVSALKPTAALSISLWAKPNAWDMTNGGNVDYFIGCVSSGGWGIRMSNSGGQVTKIEFLVRVDDSGSGSAGYLVANVNEATTEALTDWNHIAATYDGTTAKLYINAGTTGVTNATSAAGASIVYHAANSTPIMLGADAANDTTGSDFYHGLLDDVAIFDAALTAGNISTIYNGGVPNNISGMSNLVGYWLFEEGTGTTVADSSTNSNNGGVGNAWSWSTDVPE
tara:strand:- start:694 stop:1470 length:777 start_codon:yes stop_codon:yes gene_type:complete